MAKQYERKEYDGALFSNKKARGNAPPLSGYVFVDGEEVRVVAYVNEIRSGENKGDKWIKISKAQERPQEEAKEAAGDSGSAIPF